MNHTLCLPYYHSDSCGVSVLHCAVSNGNHEVVKCLLSAKVKVNVAGIRTQRTPLFLAIDGGDLTLVNLLLTHGAKTNFQDRFGELCGFEITRYCKYKTNYAISPVNLLSTYIDERIFPGLISTM